VTTGEKQDGIELLLSNAFVLSACFCEICGKIAFDVFDERNVIPALRDDISVSTEKHILNTLQQKR
jgi:hypothetical protein